MLVLVVTTFAVAVGRESELLPLVFALPGGLETAFRMPSLCLPTCVSDVRELLPNDKEADPLYEAAAVEPLGTLAGRGPEI